MSNDQGNKFSSAVTRTTAAIGVKTSVFVGSAKLKTHITTIRREIGKLTSALGETVYEAWEKGQSAEDQVERQCRQIKEKYDSIAELEGEIGKLEKQESEVLGSRKPEESKPVENPVGPACPACGAQYAAQINFCRKCGTKMA